MGPWVLREEGRGATPGCAGGAASLAFHPPLNVVLAANGAVLSALDVNSGAVLLRTTPGDTGDPVGVQYLPGADRIVVWNANALGVRSDYNGVLLLHTALQRPLKRSAVEPKLKIELFLSEAILLYQCMRTIEFENTENVTEIMTDFEEAIKRANESPRKGIKAQKWSTICLELPHNSLKTMTFTIVSELKRQKRHIPALAIASALNQQVSELMPGPVLNAQSSQESQNREIMFSEAVRRETFKKWPHMDYKWALPAQMAQAGFFYQPTISGDDRAMCFSCGVCLVCWEKTDEPWSEHERHSPDCPLVKGEYTHNVPLSATYATNPAVSHPDVSIISKGNSGNIFLTGSSSGKVSIWNVDCKLKLQQEFMVSIDETVIQSKLYGPYSSVRKAWENSNDKEAALNLTSLAIIGRCQNREQPCSKSRSVNVEDEQTDRRCSSRPSIVCGIKVDTFCASGKTASNIWRDADSKVNARTDRPSESATSPNDDTNDSKSNNINSCYLVVYDFQGKCSQTVSPLTNANGNVCIKNGTSKSGGSKKCEGVTHHNCRTEDGNIYDDIYLSKYLFNDDDMSLSKEMAFMAGLQDQATVIDFKNLVTPLTKDLESKFGPSDKAASVGGKGSIPNCIEFFNKAPITYTFHHPVCEDNILDQFVDESGEKHINFYDDADMKVPNETLDIKTDLGDINCVSGLMYEYKNSGIKMKVPYYSQAIKNVSKSSSSEPSNKEALPKDLPLPLFCRAVQCVQMPPEVSKRNDLIISHVVPTIDGDFLLVVVTCQPVDKENDSNCGLINGFTKPFELCDVDSDLEIYNVHYRNMRTSFLILYSLKFDSTVTLIDENPVRMKEIPYCETPSELCLLPNLEKSGESLGLAATVGYDGALRLLDIKTLATLAEARLESSNFVSATFCTSIEKVCVCTDDGSLYFYAVRDGEDDSAEELDEEEAFLCSSESNFVQQIDYKSMPQATNPPPSLIAHKSNLDKDDFNSLVQLAGLNGKGDNVVAYTAVVPSCWCELLPTQRSRADNQHFYRSWRLQNTASTWDEHILELTLPLSLSVSHVELKFTLHSPCATPPNIQVTLLKQHLQNIGQRRESPKYFAKIDDQIDFNLMDSEPKGTAENPVRSGEYLRAHNAEILAGPVTLAQDLDLTQQAGTLTLTSPLLYRARGRTLLIHIKTLFDPSKEMNQGKVCSSKKNKTSDGENAFVIPGSTVERFIMPSTKKKVESYIGCDWLHEISVTVRNNKHTGVPHERLQRIAMLESPQLFDNLLAVATDNGNKDQSTSLDLLIWIVSIRLTRFRGVKAEAVELDADGNNMFFSTSKNQSKHSQCHKSDMGKLQQETIKVIQNNIVNLVKKCILLSKRAISKKCAKLILICCKGAKNYDDDMSLQFEMAILESVVTCMPLIGIVQSAGSLGWFIQLMMRSVSLDFEMRCATICMQLLKDIAGIMKNLYNPYHLLLRSRFGLYGLPMESTIFDIDLPILGKASSVPLTYSSIVAGDSNTTPLPKQPEIDLRDLYNYTGKGSSGWWLNENSVCGNIAGLGEVMPLRVSFHSASDGTHLDTANNQQSCPSLYTINSDNPQLWDHFSTNKNPDPDNSDTTKNNEQEDKVDSVLECGEPPTKMEEDEIKYTCNNGLIPWQILVQQPPHQTFVIKRMHPGARHFVVLDFGYPIKLTDMIIPACTEVVSLSVDVWLNSEEQDSTRLVLAPDLSAKNLVMTNIQPPPVIQYLKITTIGRYNMSTTRCKIPLGWFYGEVADLVIAQNKQANINNLIALHQDLNCKFRLAVGKLTDCLDFYLESSGVNSAQLTIDQEQQNENYPHVKMIYQECLEIQQQINTVERIMERLEIFKRGASTSNMTDDFEKMSSAAVLKQASLDKLKTITEQLTDILLYICLECESTSLKRFISTINMSTCSLITRWLIICGGGGGPRLEAALASVLVRLCSSQPWWGSFIADTLAQLYSPSNTLIFSQNRVLILLVYMGRKSLHFEKPMTNCGGSVIECVSQLITQLLPSSDNTTPSNTDPIWQATDLALLGWLLIYLSACLDSDHLREGSFNSWSRWSFLSGKSGNSSSNNLANNAGGAMKGSSMSINRFNRRKYQKRIVHKIYMDELESVRKAYQASQQVQALSTLSSQAANLSHHPGTIVYHPMKNQDCFYKISSKNLWVKRFEEFIQSRFSSLNKLVAGYSGNSSGASSRMTGNTAGSSSDQEVLMARTRPTQLISQHLALQVSRSLISLILSMDFTCNTDILLLACKVIGRLNGLCGGLSSIVKEQEILELMQAACSPSPWHQHALLMLLQDLIEYERVGFKNETPPSTSIPVIPSDSADDGMQWHSIVGKISMSTNTFPNSDNRTDAIPIEMINPATYTINKEDSTSASASADYLMESDEDYDVEDLLDEVTERNKLSQKDIVIKNPYTTSNGASIAIDARLGSGLEICGEVLVRRLALLGGGSLAAAINSQPLPMMGTFNPTPPTEQLAVNPNADLMTMLCNCFHSLFISPDLQDNNAKLESMLQLWITLNGCTCGVTLNNSSIPDSLLTPKIKLTSQAVHAIIYALNQQINVSIRCWVLAFQCLSWVANSVNDSRDSPSSEGMAGVMIEEPQFIEMIVKFLSLNMESDSFTHGGDKPCVGPVACGTMTCLLTRISTRAPAASKIAFLRALCQLTSPTGAMRNGRGPPDAQRELLIIISFARQYNHSHLPEAMSLIDSIGVIINSMSNSTGVEVHGVGDTLSTVSSVDLGGVVGGLGGLLAEALGVGSDGVRREKPTCRRELIITLIMFAKTLLTIPLRVVQSNESSNNANSEESQTDESKAFQQSSNEGGSNVTSSRVPCLADTVLQHHPTMRRIFKALSMCSSLSTHHRGTATNNEHIFGDHPLFGDALFKFVSTLVQTTTHPRLILVPLVEYLVSGSLSDPMIRFITRALEMPNALEIFVSLGGIEIICIRLISSHKSQLCPQPGLIAALMNHLKPVQLANLSSAQSDKLPFNVEYVSGLFNYAPLGTISSSNPTAQTADALLTVINNGNGNCGNNGGGGGAHRRTRSAAWSHHFSRGDTSVDLCVKLPHAILLHEVQLQPHLSTSSTCPSAVSLEVCTQGCVITPLGPPQLTAGMTYIRLRLVNPLIVNTVLVRLYKPRDSSTLGLLSMRILGSSAFNTTIFDKVEEKLASTSAGWALILWQCLCGSENEIQMDARRRASCIVGLVEALSGLFLSSLVPSSTLKSLLLLLGSETPTTLRVLSLILYNGHIPAHQVSRNTSKSPVDSVCDLLYQLCIIQDSHSMQRIKTFIDWLKDCGESVISRLRSGSSHHGATMPNLNHNTKYLNPVYVQCFAAVLWYAKEQHFDYNLKSLITDDLFDTICAWIEVLPMHTNLKRSLNSVLCSLCYIRPELFNRMLNKMGVLNNEGMHIEESISDDSKDLVAKEALTDDTKVYRENNQNINPSIDPVNLTPSQLMTISATCMSPEATKVLLKSNILNNITKAIEKFCDTYKASESENLITENPLTDSDKFDNKTISLEMMPTFIEWLYSLCIDAEIKDWLGGPVGSCFLKPLLMILCVSDYDSKCTEKSVLMTQLEEKTIKLFSALTSCHTINRYLFAQILFDVIKSYQEIVAGVGTSIGGFLCRLLLRLLLRNEQISVGMRIKGENITSKDNSLSFYSKLMTNGTLPPHYLSSHPSLYGCILLSLPHQTQLSDILQHLLLNGSAWPTNNSSANNNHAKKSTVAGNLIEAGNSHQGNTSAIDAWELSVAAANTAKDKRTKDARNLCAKQAMLQCKKKLSRRAFSASGKKDDPGSSSVFNTNNVHDTLSSDNLRISIDGLDGYVSPNVNLGVLSASTVYRFGPNLNININSLSSNDITEIINEHNTPLNTAQSNPSLLSIFASIGGLALLAHHLPPICPPVPLPSQPNKETTNVEEWVKLDDVYEDVAAEASSSSTSEESSSIVPTHSLVALGLLLRLPGYAEALLKEGQRAVYLLRLLLGVTDDGEGKEIMAVCGPGLGTLSFRVLGSLLESLPLSTDDGMLLRYNLVQSGTLRLLLLCLAVFTHQQPESPPSESNQNNGTFTKSKAEEKSKLYWAKGTGFGTGSTQQSWNVEESLLRQRTEEEHVTVLLQVIASYIHPGEFWNVGDTSSKIEEEAVKSNISDETNTNLPPEFFNIIHQSALLSAVSSYLRNDSVLDMSRHIPLYLAVMKVVRAIMTCQSLCLQQGSSISISSSLAVIPPLLHQMSCTVNTYATKLKMNKKTAFSKTATTATDGCEDDEGLALLIPDIQATSALVQKRLGMNEASKGLANASATLIRPPSTATREARYLEVMKRLQFETFEMIGDCGGDKGYKFNVSYHFETTVRAAGEHSHPARMKRLAQEAVTLSTSLPLSYSSSVFVRTDQDRLDIMKVLITGPSDTPYANGCFELDVYFPIDYPNTPMLINLETTGKHSVRFNPNLYIDGKVCLSVLNTWHGRPEEQWNAQTSSFLQVLVSIQSLILVPEPYFNEPGFERSRGTPGGTNHSLEYNSNIYQACVRWAMLEQLRNPTSCFQQVIQTHFWLKRDEICTVIEGWIEELESQSGDKRTQRNIKTHMIALKRHYKSLREELAKLKVPPGLEDLETPFDEARATSDSPAPSSPDVEMDQLVKKMVSQMGE